MKTMRGSPNSIRGNGHRKTRNDVRPLAKAKQNEGIGEKRATRYACRSWCLYKGSYVLLWVI